MSIFALALVLALQPSDDDVFAYGNVLFRVPEGWKVEQKDEGLFLRPGDLKKAESYVVIIPPGTKAEVNLAAGFEKTWKQVAGPRKIAKKAPEREIKTDGGVDGLMSVGLMDDADDSRMIATVVLFKPGDRFQAVLALTAEDHVFQRYSEATGRLIRGLRFRNIELPAYELLMSMGYDEKGGKTAVYVLFRDGTGLTTLPVDGLDRLEPAAAKTRHARFAATHETKDGVVKVRSGAREEELKPQSDGSFRAADRAQFLKLAPSTGLRLDGKYVLHGGEGGFVFRPDGTCDDEGGKPATYEIYNNTIYLTAADRTVRRLAFMTLSSPKKEFIYLGSAWYLRR